MKTITRLNKASRFARGFTLVEIMIVVAIIALLAAIAIPNVLRGRATANETAAIGNVRALMSSLEMYRSVYQAYPAPASSWTAQMYGPNPAFGPPVFGTVAMDGTGSVQGFFYTYGPSLTLPAQSYVMKATPTAANSGGRTFFTTESGQVFHCAGINVTTMIVATTTIDQIPSTAC